MGRRSARNGHPPRRARSPASNIQPTVTPGIALAYVYQVRIEFKDEPHVYNQFLDLMKDFKVGQITAEDVIGRLAALFRGHKDLLLGFNTFLPKGCKLIVTEDGDGVLQSTNPEEAAKVEQNDVTVCACCGAVNRGSV